MTLSVRPRRLRACAGRPRLPGGRRNTGTRSVTVAASEPASSAVPAEAAETVDVDSSNGAAPDEKHAGEKLTDAQALDNAVSEFTADNQFALGAVPSNKPPQKATVLSGGPDQDGDAATDSSLHEQPVANQEQSSAYQTVELTTPAGEPTRQKQVKKRAPGPDPTQHTQPPKPPEEEERKAGEHAAKQTGEAAASSPVRRLANLTGSGRPAGRPAYRPRSAMSLARRRMIATYLPFDWQQGIRKRAEDIPEQQFNYLLSTLSIAFSAVVGGSAAYTLWPYLRSFVIWIFAADSVEARVLQELTFETQYLAAISLVTAILLGNTFGWSFDRQRQIIAEMSEEVFAIELLLQELFIEISEPHLRWRVIKHIKRYIDDEIQARDIDSPFRVDGAIMGLFNALLTLREEGKPISKMIASVEMLAQANSRRGALASALLPPLHWVLLTSLAGLLLSAFLLFDSDFSNPVGENRIIFAVLSATLISILQVLRDIAAPDDGLYSVRDPMENRLTYVRWQMDNILSDPAIKVSIMGKDETDGQTEAEESGQEKSKNDADAEPSWMQES